MKTKTKEERSAATKFIADEAVQSEIKRAAREGGKSCSFLVEIFFLFIRLNSVYYFIHNRQY